MFGEGYESIRPRIEGHTVLICRVDSVKTYIVRITQKLLCLYSLRYEVYFQSLSSMSADIGAKRKRSVEERNSAGGPQSYGRKAPSPNEGGSEGSWPIKNCEFTF